ncbi:unnamed protein product [Discula destructiva]
MRPRSQVVSALARPSSLVLAPSCFWQTLPSEILRLCQTHRRGVTPLIASPAVASWNSRRHASSSSHHQQPTPIPASHLLFGQPVHETHPELLSPGELTPSITAQEYHDRRTRLASLLPPDSIAILPAATLKWRSGAVFHPFRQESNFLYLTGFAEPEALAVVHKTGTSNDAFAFHLYVRPKNPALEQWSGPWSGVDAAEDVFNADVVGDIGKAGTLLTPLLRHASKIYTDACAADLAVLFPTHASHLKATPKAPLGPLINTLRIIKSPAELSAMRHAGRISGRAITNAMRRRWANEHELASFLNYAFTTDGLSGPAYVPVVAGGSRANMIHYVHNNQALKEEEMVLVDAGGEYGTYIADITRTWPVSGKFSAAQADLYGAVLNAQRKGVAMCRADKGVSLDAIHRATETTLKTELSALGFEMTAPSAVSELFPHHVGHYVGLDVHDCPGYGRNVPLKKGMCVTVEPGVYVPDDERFPKHFRGMGIRIEDSVAVDDTGPIVLSVEAVKEIVDIETLTK